MRGGTIDYDRYAPAYPDNRRGDPRIGARVPAALGSSRTVVNVGAGAGSYEPRDRHVIAIEPSAGMRGQRPPKFAPAIATCAEALPLDDDSVDAAMAIITVHHWRDPAAGLREMRRVARGPVLVLTFDIDVLTDYWMIADYLPEALADDRLRFPSIEAIVEILGGASVEAIPIPSDCTDGFFEAHYAQPEAYLDAAVRAAQSVWPRLPAGVEQRAIKALQADLRSGAWDTRHGHLRSQASYEGGLRLIVSHPHAAAEQV
jgi:SAM-dependent methyltransferase